MKCVIPGLNVKIFGRTVHSLSKIGDELYFEPMQQGLAIRTVNSTRSAYAYILFAPSFFSNYDDGSSLLNSNGSDAEEEDIMRCKVNMKSILTVFKSLSSIEKSVERCKISLNNKDSRLVFQLYCKHGIVKTHNLAFIECETLQAVFSKDLTPNKLTAHPKLLCDAVVNFQNNQEEVTLIAKPDKISLKNYVEDEVDPKKVVLTEMHLNPKEFDTCQLGVDAEITFCLKELRAILGLADVISLPLNIHFERAGRPVVISIDSDVTFEANFVLATLADVDTSSSQSRSAHTSKNLHDDEFEDDFEEMICNDPTVDQMTSMKNTSSNMKTSKSLAPTVDHNSPTPSPSDQSGSPVIPFQNLDEEDDLIPGTPPSKKFKSMVFGFSQSSTQYESSQQAGTVLAVDTDEDD
ncbi:hypothetical protein LOTGIDRAFT_232267 [Lottia gigantea]|uniref:Cell cycle checkpoint control protein n=1 Tax=Lottia gigantea TaxID=225164 RepID=V3ZTQ8_LOTGI|nr:hypothetical protein LOTGIDRAFT_232267 [Lottia gigantea]ESO94828.1 hypothetical protein LOTGIDRAFT_232267 [Lottia gigantea]